MAEKQPVPAPDEVPSCFGDRHREADFKCADCAVQPDCARSSAQWHERHSLSELLAEIEHTLDTESEHETVEETYARLYQEFFGRKPRHGASAQHERGFNAVRALPEGIDHATYIAGNMWAMQDFAKASQYGFLPIMLSGEKAMRRYAAYLGKMGRRYRHGRHSAKNTHTERGRFRRQLFEAEHEIAEWFVAGRVSGRSESWEDAVRYVEPNETWTAAHGKGPSSVYHRLCSVFGTKALVREREYATLRAAAAIAEQHQHRLADRIGVRGFSWPDFADLLTRLTPEPAVVLTPDLSEIEGRTWPW